jgi:hypothetical protein
MMKRTANPVALPLVGRTENIWLCDQTEIVVATDNRKCPARHPNPRLNCIEKWAASDVIGCGRTRRSNKYFHEPLKNNAE